MFHDLWHVYINHLNVAFPIYQEFYICLQTGAQCIIINYISLAEDNASSQLAHYYFRNAATCESAKDAILKYHFKISY